MTSASCCMDFCTSACIAKITPVSTHAKSRWQSTQLLLSGCIWVLCVPRRELHAASDQIIWQANYSCANMYTPSAFKCLHSDKIRQIVQSAVSAWPTFREMHSWVLLSCSLPRVSCFLDPPLPNFSLSLLAAAVKLTFL